MAKLTVIIPTFNVENFIAETLESVFSQTFKDYEVIVIDDGSTDKTREKIEPYLPRIRYYYQENQGAPVARNKGLEKARGEFVTFLDSDDIWLPDNLNLKMTILNRHPELGGLFSDFSIFNMKGTIHPHGIKKLYPFFNRTRKDFQDIFHEREKIRLGNGKETFFYYGNIFDNLFLGNFILTSTVVFKKDFILKVGKFDLKLRTQQDYEYFLRISKKYPLGYINEVLVNYRRHSQQLTSHANIERIVKTVLRIIDQYEDEFESKGKINIFNKRKAVSLLTLAKVYLGSGQNLKARQILKNNVKLHPYFLENYLHFPISYVPSRVVSFLRNKL